MSPKEPLALYEGSDGMVEYERSRDLLTFEDRREIAEFMVRLWQQWAKPRAGETTPRQSTGLRALLEAELVEAVTGQPAVVRHEWKQADGMLAAVGGSGGQIGASCDWGDGNVVPCSPDVLDWMPEMLRLAAFEKRVTALLANGEAPDSLHTMVAAYGDHEEAPCHAEAAWRWFVEEITGLPWRNFRRPVTG